jgi:hypothetical protein
MNKTSVKEVGASSLKWAAIGSLVGLGIGAWLGFDRVRKRVALQEALTTNQDLDLSALMSDAGACDAFADLMKFRELDPVAYDSALYNANELILLQYALYRDLNNPAVIVEHIPQQVSAVLVQLQRALSHLHDVVMKQHGYMQNAYKNAASDVLRRFTDISYNVSADVRDRKNRPAYQSPSASPAVSPNGRASASSSPATTPKPQTTPKPPTSPSSIASPPRKA